jgi:4-hydroxy-tetrahydrodipicolinate synthase
VTDPDLRGTWFVLPTPFGEDGSVDLPSQRRLVDAAADWGVDGLTALGVTSEAGELAPEERTAALDAVAEANDGRLPLVVGCSAGDAGAVTALMEEAATRGATAAMVAAPPGASDPDRVREFFGRLGDGGLPVVVQDEPAATGVGLSVEALLGCVGAAGAGTVKLEDPPTPPKIARLLAVEPELRVFGGLGGVAALAELRAGACGTMTGFAFPEVLRELRVRLEAGDQAAASRVFDRYLPLIQFEAQPGVGLAVRKELLRRRGVIATATTRRGLPLDSVTASELDDVLRRLRIVPAREAFSVGT